MGTADRNADASDEVRGSRRAGGDDELARAKEALQARERELSLIYSNVSDVIFYVRVEPDGAYRFVSVNQAFLDATGLREERVIGRRVDEVIPQPSRSLVL